MTICARALGDDDSATDYASRAVLTDPSRAEGYMALAQAEWDRQNWSRAIPLYSAATAARRPPDGFVHDPDYSWRSWDYLSVCLSNAGRHEDGIQAALKSIQLGNPDPERLRANIAWSLAQL
jgi:tetratricopeptide (TPR) repeat protein